MHGALASRTPRGTLAPKAAYLATSHESQSKPGTQMVYPEPCKEFKKAAAAIYGWDCPLPTVIYPGFDCGSHGEGSKAAFTSDSCRPSRRMRCTRMWHMCEGQPARGSKHLHLSHAVHEEPVCEGETEAEIRSPSIQPPPSPEHDSEWLLRPSGLQTNNSSNSVPQFASKSGVFSQEWWIFFALFCLKPKGTPLPSQNTDLPRLQLGPLDPGDVLEASHHGISGVGARSLLRLQRRPAQGSGSFAQVPLRFGLGGGCKPLLEGKRETTPKAPNHQSNYKAAESNLFVKHPFKMGTLLDPWNNLARASIAAFRCIGPPSPSSSHLPNLCPDRRPPFAAS